MACYRCGRKSHFASDCFASTSVRGRFLDSDSESDDESVRFRARKKTRRSTTSRPVARDSGIYVLKTLSGLYYVGKSNNIGARIQEHRSGAGASCLDGSPFQVLPSLLTSGSSADLESWERNETLQRMRAHGIENVRGWMFTSRELTEAHRQDAFHQICEKFDLCRRCGRGTHFAERCYARTRDGWAGDIGI